MLVPFDDLFVIHWFLSYVSVHSMTNVFKATARISEKLIGFVTLQLPPASCCFYKNVVYEYFGLICWLIFCSNIFSLK
ncbi:hypothetical protein TNCV_2626111 [Trichonephila clavipes]|uniref:Uncharacterized protein n=1 Tax=Trichonephila clavipes TaxID=2585209 RepID=A0A8X6W7A3_TRICX|nr:hypothetical protein TNCV_2626111 [Trichonephila clavipes]